MTEESKLETGRRGFMGALGSLASVSATRIEGARLPEPVLDLSGVEAPSRS